MYKEPHIEINGQVLDNGEAMTVRVAIEKFATDLRSEGLGDDEMGRNITDGYLGSIQLIRQKMYSKD